LEKLDSNDEQAGKDKAYGDLANAFRKSKITISESSYTFEWKVESKEWEVIFPNLTNVTAGEFEADLKKIVQDKEQAKPDHVQHEYEKSRVWSRIEFRRPGGTKSVASIKIKYSK
jgi:hypothetical protein